MPRFSVRLSRSFSQNLAEDEVVFSPGSVGRLCRSVLTLMVRLPLLRSVRIVPRYMIRPIFDRFRQWIEWSKNVFSDLVISLVSLSISSRFRSKAVSA